MTDTYYLQKSASIQPRTSPVKFAKHYPKVRIKVRKHIGPPDAGADAAPHGPSDGLSHGPSDGPSHGPSDAFTYRHPEELRGVSVER